jgi:hypothetical protein
MTYRHKCFSIRIPKRLNRVLVSELAHKTSILNIDVMRPLLKQQNDLKVDPNFFLATSSLQLLWLRKTTRAGRPVDYALETDLFDWEKGDWIRAEVR